MAVNSISKSLSILTNQGISFDEAVENMMKRFTKFVIIGRERYEISYLDYGEFVKVYNMKPEDCENVEEIKKRLLALRL